MKTLDSMETYEKINLADYFQAAAVHALQVAAENKHLIGLQLRYHVRGIIRTLYSIVRSHIGYNVLYISFLSKKAPSSELGEVEMARIELGPMQIVRQEILFE